MAESSFFVPAHVECAIERILAEAQVTVREDCMGTFCPGPVPSTIRAASAMFDEFAEERFAACCDAPGFKQALSEAMPLVEARAAELYTDVVGSDMPTGVAKQVRQRLADRRDFWMLEFWRRVKAKHNASRADAERPAQPAPASSAGTGSRSVVSQCAAARVRSHMQKNGLGKTEFARIVGMTDRTLRSFLKTGRLKVGYFEAVASALGLTKAELLAESSD